MIVFWVLWFGLMTPAWADIFTKPATSSEQTTLQSSVQADSHGHYFKNDLDYNISQTDADLSAMSKDTVPVGLRRFDFQQSLDNLIKDKTLNNSQDIPANSVVNAVGSVDPGLNIMTQLGNNPLMTYQYSSPALADLYKHFDTIANLRLILRYEQYQDMERSVNDPLMRLRKQAELDCLNRSASQTNMEQAFQNCLANSGALQTLNKPSSGNADGSGNGYISGTVGVIQSALGRVANSNDNWEDIEEIIPEVNVTSTSVTVQPAAKQIRQIFSDSRQGWISSFNSLLNKYKSNRTAAQTDLDQFFVSGTPLTQTQLRNLSLLSANDQVLNISQWSSQLAYLQTMNKYAKALEWLNRALDHPAIEPAYKGYIQTRADYIREQMDELSQEKSRLEDYAKFMGHLIDRADEERLKTIAQIKY